MRGESTEQGGQQDAGGDPVLDELARLAAQICDAALALVCLSGPNCLYLKASSGINTGCPVPASLPWQPEMAAGTIHQISDMGVESGTSWDGIVAAGGIYRFYAATPLETSRGSGIGALVVLDRQPRHLSETQSKALCLLAKQASIEIELNERQAELTAWSQQRVESALTIEGEFVSAVLDTIGALVVVLDAEGRVVRFNRAAEMVSGYEFSVLAGRHIWDWLTPKDDIPEAIKGFQNLKEGAFPASFESRWQNRNGEMRQISWAATALRDGEGKVVFLIATGNDITTQRAVELTLRESETERHVLDRMKDEFISTVSHELRTPLTSLRGALGLLSGGALQARPEKSEQMLEIAISNTDRLVRLVNDILDLERISSGKNELRFAMVRADWLLNEAVNMQKARTPGLKIQLFFAADEVKVWADPDRVLQVLNNLLSNAIKFSTQEEEIHLTARNLNDQEAIFEVRDHGRGIAPDKLENIFDRFRQGDASDSRALGGVGLGLAICRSIVHQHGGKIWATSTVGKGTTIHFTLPIRQRANLR